MSSVQSSQPLNGEEGRRAAGSIKYKRPMSKQGIGVLSVLYIGE